MMMLASVAAWQQVGRDAPPFDRVCVGVLASLAVTLVCCIYMPDWSSGVWKLAYADEMFCFCHVATCLQGPPL
jgi:hypothetical protein